jgi:hypothetical protein
VRFCMKELIEAVAVIAALIAMIIILGRWI